MGARKRQQSMNPLGWQAGDRSWDSGDMSVAGSRGASPLSYTAPPTPCALAPLKGVNEQPGRTTSRQFPEATTRTGQPRRTPDSAGPCKRSLLAK